ncbi:hypothetical protein AN958_05391, partial [Leucoagaricus sp. SymC.cos]
INDSPKQKWKQLANRRCGEITAKGLLPQALPSYLTTYPAIVDRLKGTGAFARSPHQQPNHVILNEYKPGQGIMPHQDGPKYFPVVATISLGSHTVFNYYQHKLDHVDSGANEGKVLDQVPVLSVLLEPRSLIISSGEMYTFYLHGIDPLEEDRVTPPNPAITLPLAKSRDLSTAHQYLTPINNWEVLGDENLKQSLANGGVLKRGTRYSLTCRDVERISSARSFRFI